MNQNFVDRMFMTVIEGLCTTEWQWPPGWTVERKKKFLENCRSFAEQRELYEECAIIRDVEKELEVE